jgi:hypothetical protein
MKIHPVGVKLFQGDRWTGGQTDGRTDGWADRRTGGQTDRRMGGQTDGRAEKRKDQSQGRFSQFCKRD